MLLTLKGLCEPGQLRLNSKKKKIPAVFILDIHHLNWSLLAFLLTKFTALLIILQIPVSGRKFQIKETYASQKRYQLNLEAS